MGLYVVAPAVCCPREYSLEYRKTSGTDVRRKHGPNMLVFREDAFDPASRITSRLFI